eukprot:858026-Rhodomonas_salina.1
MGWREIIRGGERGETAGAREGELEGAYGIVGGASQHSALVWRGDAEYNCSQTLAVLFPYQ